MMSCTNGCRLWGGGYRSLVIADFWTFVLVRWSFAERTLQQYAYG